MKKFYFGSALKLSRCTRNKKNCLLQMKIFTEINTRASPVEVLASAENCFVKKILQVAP